MTERRDREYAALCDALGENTKSKAIDRAVRLTLEMRGNSRYRSTGILDELIATANERGSLTAREIAAIASTDEVPVEFESTWSVGESE